MLTGAHFDKYHYQIHLVKQIVQYFIPVHQLLWNQLTKMNAMEAVGMATQNSRNSYLLPHHPGQFFYGHPPNMTANSILNFQPGGQASPMTGTASSVQNHFYNQTMPHQYHQYGPHHTTATPDHQTMQGQFVSRWLLLTLFSDTKLQYLIMRRGLCKSTKWVRACCIFLVIRLDTPFRI